MDERNPRRAGVPESGLLYGYARPTSWGFLVVHTGWVGEAVRGADQVGPIETSYTDRATGAVTSQPIRPIVACPHGQRLWVETGWALDNPGQLAPAHPLGPPAPDLLYTKAVEQLGHEQAAVRLGGLYALERLAQDHPEQRRPVVSVLCAYLRMP